MSTKPENQFIKSVHAKFTKGKPHFEKMHNPYRAGIWDVWYSGENGDMWIEYKWLPKWLKNGKIFVPGLTARQLKWGLARHMEGRNMVVIVGGPGGRGLILKDANSWERAYFWDTDLTDLHDIATEILLQVGEQCATPESSSSGEDRRIVL